MFKLITATAVLASLSGCSMPMICGPAQPDGYTRCDPMTYTQPAPDVSYVSPPGPGYAPAYQPHQPYVLHPQHEWVTDTPHWNPGDQ